MGLGLNKVLLRLSLGIELGFGEVLQVTVRNKVRLGIQLIEVTVRLGKPGRERSEFSSIVVQQQQHVYSSKGVGIMTKLGERKK